MANGSMLIAPFLESWVNVIGVCLHQCPYSNCRLNQRSEELLLDIRQQLDRDVSCSLNHSQNRWFFGGQCTAPPGASEPMPSSLSPWFPDRFRRPFRPGNDVQCITGSFTPEFGLWLFFTMPSRSCVGIWWLSSLWRSHA
jgi:hypothetical protein